MRPQGVGDVLALLRKHGVHPRKALGQHFLADPNLTEKIVAVAGVESGSKVLEVGAGTGTLTASLAATGARVVAYEIDQALRPVLEEVLGGAGNVELRFADVARLDLADELEGDGWSLVANLPYNVGTPILLEVLRRVPSIERMVVMVQLEVAERLVARPGDAAYGLPSVVTGLNADASIAFRVPPQVFVPRPQVGSAVVVADRIPAHRLSEQAIELAASAFGQRRKMLRRSLSERFHDPAAVLATAGVEGSARPEELGPQDWIRLAEAATG